MVDRIATFSIYQTSIDNFQKNQADLGKIENQVSTGNKATNFADLGSQLPQSLNLNTLVSINNAYSASNTSAENRMQSYDGALSQLQDINTQLQTAITTQRSSSAPNNPLAQTAANLLQNVQSILNTQFDGQYLFSGSKTDSPPVSNLSTTNLVNGVPTDNYYQGDAVTLSTQTSTNFNLKYGITAANPAIQNLIGALNEAIQGDDGTSTNTLLTSADTLSNQVTSQLSNLRASNGNNLAQIKSINTDNASTLTYMQQVQSQISDTDITAASVQVSEDQTILTASYQIFAKISSLNLTNFLPNG